MKVAKQETAATASATTPAAVKSPESANHRFPYHSGRRNQPERCRSHSNSIKIKGFANAKALNMDGKVRVSISSLDNRNEATKQLLGAKKNETYKNARYWLNKTFKSMKRVLFVLNVRITFFDETKYSGRPITGI